MLLIGHKDIPSIIFSTIQSTEEIANTPSSSTLLFDFNIELSKYCNSNGLSFALHVKNIKELIFANALGANYFVVDKSLAINAQKVAEEYLFDGKVLLLSEDENDIEFAASYAIDGILFGNGIQ